MATLSAMHIHPHSLGDISLEDFASTARPDCEESETTNSNHAATSMSSIEIGSDTCSDSVGSTAYNSNSETVKDLRFWLVFVLFMIMGSGANWVFATALAQEIPYYENHMASGDCIATYMNAATNASFVAVVVYLCINSYYPIPHKYAVPSLLILSAFGSFLCAATSTETIHGAPVALLISCAIGGIVGGLAGVIMQPFLTYFRTDYISGARAGGSGCMVLTALVAIAQDPGTENQHFSVGVYFIIFGIILSLAVIAYFVIIQLGLGLKDPNITPLNSISAAEGSLRSSEVTMDSIYNNKLHMEAVLPKDNDTGLFATVRRTGDALCATFMDLCIPSSLFVTYPWLRVTLPYLMTVAWIDFNTWGMLSAVGPFAMYNTSYGGGALNLAVALELGSFALFFGDFSTVYFRLPFFLSLVAFSAFTFTVYVYASFPDIAFNRSTAPIVIAIWTIGRYLEAHMLTTCYRAVATEVPLHQRESAARAVGLFDQIFTTLGAVLSTTLVSTLDKC